MYLTDEELEKFGIERIHSRCYMIPCEICGKKVRRTQFSFKRRYICDYCNGTIKKKEKIQIPSTKTKNEIRFDKAVEEIEKQVKSIEEYENAIRIAKTRCERYGSIPEAMVAIELLKLKHKIVPQQKIGKYKVDFVVTDIKTVIEVDGETYHRKINWDREATIQTSLGFDWKVKHIPSELIRKNINKLKEIIEL